MYWFLERNQVDKCIERNCAEWLLEKKLNLRACFGIQILQTGLYGGSLELNIS